MKNEKSIMKNEKVCHPELKAKDISKILHFIQNDKINEINERTIANEVVISHETIILDQTEHFQ
jgi:hypothetical protein